VLIRVRLFNTGTPLCKNCGAKEGEIYATKLAEVNAQQRVFNMMWTECQRCQGSFHQEVRCCRVCA
jgi:DNA polymerase delta subunit 1